MSLNHKVKNKYDNFIADVSISETEHLEIQARMATSYIERWGMVAAEPDGEDSSGRQKLRLTTPEEVVDRAVTVAELSMLAFRRKGWVHCVPTLEEAENIAKDLEDSK